MNKEQEKQLVAKAWKNDAFFFENNTEYLTGEREAATAVVEIDNMMLELVESEGDQFRMEEGRRGRKVARMTPVGARFVKCLFRDGPYVFEEFFPDSTFSPYVELFLEYTTGFRCVVMEVNEDTVVGFNGVLNDLREAAKADSFRDEVANLDRMVRKNTASVLNYIDRAFEHHSSLLVVRLDLHYQGAFCGLRSRTDPVTAEEARAHLRTFLKHLRKSYPDLVAYVWKLEGGILRSFHYHLLLIFNGNFLREDEVIGDALGRYWMEMATGGMGTFYNCNRHKDHYRQRQTLGIGMIYYQDIVMRMNLQDVARYLTKRDLYIRLQAPDVKRTFGRGFIAPRTGNKLGRPRRTLH